MKKDKKKFDAVKYMREQRDKLSLRLSGMSKEEILQYFKDKKGDLKIKPSA